MQIAIYFMLFIVIAGAILASKEIRAYLRLSKLNFIDRATVVKNAQARTERRSADTASTNQKFLAFFVVLSFFCAVVGLHYSATYSAFWASFVLSEVIKDVLLVKTARYNDVDSPITEAQPA